MSDYPKKAFPYEESYMNHGMDLRDYFAIQYVNGIISNFNFDSCMTFEQVCKNGYEMADAMIKARLDK